MKKWLKRIRGALGMGLIWAIVWAPIGILIGMIVDPDNSMDEMWVAIGAYPGFLGGVVFATVIGIAARRQRLDELSIPGFAAWGAIAGLIVGSIPFVIGDSSTEMPTWLFASIVIGVITLMSAASAAGSLAIARMADEPEVLGAGADKVDSGLPVGAREEVFRSGR